MNKNNEFKKFENKNNFQLESNKPIIIRIDGCHFKSFTKGLNKFNQLFDLTMIQTMKYLCENIPDCKFGFTQSDEISLLLLLNNEENDGWFNLRLQKLCSVSASLATLAFNFYWTENTATKRSLPATIEYMPEEKQQEYIKQAKLYSSKLNSAYFDARAFNIENNLIQEYFIYRQNDCMKNSIQTFGRVYFNQSVLKNLNTQEIKEKIKNEKNVVWEESITRHQQIGSFCIKVEKQVEVKNKNKTKKQYVTRKKWEVKDGLLFSDMNNLFFNFM